jgi:hypothetical protein
MQPSPGLLLLSFRYESLGQMRGPIMKHYPPKLRVTREALSACTRFTFFLSLYACSLFAENRIGYPACRDFCSAFTVGSRGKVPWRLEDRDYCTADLQSIEHVSHSFI